MTEGVPVVEPLEVSLTPSSAQRLETVLHPAQRTELAGAIDRAPRALAGRTTWNVNSTASGGGVAEMLTYLLPYSLGVGVATRWLVIQGDASFFALTKRIHNRLHGAVGDGGALDGGAASLYEAILGANAPGLIARVRSGDIIILHDPQTAGLIPLLKRAGLGPVVWRCHVGVDEPNELVAGAWDFLRDYVRQADAVIFSRREYAWSGLDAVRVVYIAPSIDPFAAKNLELPQSAVGAILGASGIQDGSLGEAAFTRRDGGPGQVAHRAELLEVSRLAPLTPLVLQISRWDRLKDPVGVIDGFATHIAPVSDAHLLYAGPAFAEVADDPEGRDAYLEARATWLSLARPARERVHLATLPMDDLEENAIIVNALQRRADVVVQKSLAEGFGLTVAEAMWKSRPVVASRVGGIQDQIVDGVSGALIDPTDRAAYGAAVLSFLGDGERARAVGVAARERVRDHFLGSRHLLQYLELLSSLIGSS